MPFFFLSFFFLASLMAQSPPPALAPWTPGTLDLHQIHTGRGNALYAVLPDGTNLLFDAGDVPDAAPLELGPRLGSVAAYLKRLTPKLDYLVASHYHNDHIGGIGAVLAALPVGTWIDRGTQPAPLPSPEYFQLRAAFSGRKDTIIPGARNQIRSRYPNFEIRNIAANGMVWTGEGEQARSVFPAHWESLPKDQHPNENHFSIALRFRYGAFDYFTGADLIGVVLDGLPAWHDLETPVAKVVGPVDALVLNHHGWLDTTNDFFLKTLNPRIAILPSWHASHPDHSVLRRLRSPRGPRPDLFATSLLDAPKAVFRYLLKDAFRSTDGHVLIRVAPGGATYQVFILDASREDAPVRASFGPYMAR